MGTTHRRNQSAHFASVRIRAQVRNNDSVVQRCFFRRPSTVCCQREHRMLPEGCLPCFGCTFSGLWLCVQWCACRGRQVACTGGNPSTSPGLAEQASAHPPLTLPSGFLCCAFFWVCKRCSCIPLCCTDACFQQTDRSAYQTLGASIARWSKNVLTAFALVPAG